MIETNGRQVGRVQIARMEDDGVRFVEQQPVGRCFAVACPASGRFERFRTQTEIETGAAVVFRPEEDDFRLAVHIGRSLFVFI